MFPHLFCSHLISLGKRELLPEEQLESSQLIDLVNKQKALFSQRDPGIPAFEKLGQEDFGRRC